MNYFKPLHWHALRDLHNASLAGPKYASARGSCKWSAAADHLRTTNATQTLLSFFFLAWELIITLTAPAPLVHNSPIPGHYGPTTPRTLWVLRHHHAARRSTFESSHPQHPNLTRLSQVFNAGHSGDNTPARKCASPKESHLQVMRPTTPHTWPPRSRLQISVGTIHSSARIRAGGYGDQLEHAQQVGDGLCDHAVAVARVAARQRHRDGRAALERSAKHHLVARHHASRAYAAPAEQPQHGMCDTDMCCD